MFTKRNETLSFICLWGEKLFLDEGHKHEHSSTSGEKKDEDFFHEHSQASPKTVPHEFATISSKGAETRDDELGEGPSVDPNLLNNDAAAGKSLDPKKTTIGQRRAAPAKKVRRANFSRQNAFFSVSFRKVSARRK